VIDIISHSDTTSDNLYYVNFKPIGQLTGWNDKAYCLFSLPPGRRKSLPAACQANRGWQGRTDRKAFTFFSRNNVPLYMATPPNPPGPLRLTGGIYTPSDVQDRFVAKKAKLNSLAKLKGLQAAKLKGTPILPRLNSPKEGATKKEVVK